jgi:hypothetical protein
MMLLWDPPLWISPLDTPLSDLTCLTGLGGHLLLDPRLWNPLGVPLLGGIRFRSPFGIPHSEPTVEKPP